MKDYSKMSIEEMDKRIQELNRKIESVVSETERIKIKIEILENLLLLSTKN